MTVLYFSSTGNNLYVAKKIGGAKYSIPALVEKGQYEFKDDCIGIVFPIYGLCVPPFIEEFIKNLRVECGYFFAIATYGFFPGAVCGQLMQICSKNGRTFDYINRLKMAENCITFSDMAKQKGDSAKQQKDLEKILLDIVAKKTFVRKDSFLGKIMTSHHLEDYEFPTGEGVTGKIKINKNCCGCGTCTKVCPMKNIKLVHSNPSFEKNCISCGACLQNCPANALHHEMEKSSARYRNPHVQLCELMYR
ncbi:MAG: EFR1 family ferrodoxin [Treponema sp.]|nr:EFR1 family ferrodoxin [Candidatus Treponema equifaecale]